MRALLLYVEMKCDHFKISISSNCLLYNLIVNHLHWKKGTNESTVTGSIKGCDVTPGQMAQMKWVPH